MSSPIPPTPRRGFWMNNIRRNDCPESEVAESTLNPPPMVSPMPPTPSPLAARVLCPIPRESARSPSSALRSKVLCSTPYRSNKPTRKTAPNRRASPFPLLIPTELTLSIIRESPLTAVEELTCGDHVEGKEDSMSSSTRPAEESATITERQCVAFGTPRGTSVATTAAATVTAGVATIQEIPESIQNTMGACASRKSSSTSEKNGEKSPPSAKPGKPLKTAHPPAVNDDAMDANDAIDEDDPAHSTKFKLKRDSIAVTKVRLMKTQVHQETTIGEEEEAEEQERDDSGRGEDHVHFDNHVSKQSIPNDSGVSLNSCPDNDLESLCQEDRERSNEDFSSIKFDGTLDCDSTSEISLASNVTLRSLRREKVVDDENRSFDFKALRQRTEQLIEDQREPNTKDLSRTNSIQRW
ncbi:serine/arginine repetitive matrix protein 1 [Galendromus occidentalis]|uniref:Serine/arginine repetitive matrix protein 1 n=1 Tax=Galendromus occidentalis TaxID=34638 RepID=A0AAJ6QP34_9ACAR|nr:serine/arginine repetitive matrix protein 1 [Galendromus occidentalis]